MTLVVVQESGDAIGRDGVDGDTDTSPGAELGKVVEAATLEAGAEIGSVDGDDLVGIGGVGLEAGVIEDGGVRRHGGHGGPCSGVGGLAEDLEAGFIGGVVSPRELDAGRGDGRHGEIAGGGGG